MFTGLVEEIGTIKDFQLGLSGADIVVECSKILEDVKIGDSIAINGCCQTVVECTSNYFRANVSEETLKITNFDRCKKGDCVNLERALSVNSRLGGHIVQGHIDGLGIFVDIVKKSEFYEMYFEINSNIDKYIVTKGSITINGVSLTIAEIKNRVIKIAVIPHTFNNTMLKSLKIGESVNIETDILGRYVEKFLLQQDNVSSNIDENFLKENGFM